MALIEAMIEELKHEAVGTRKTLERVPRDKPDWSPHAKSMKLERLAAHLAEIPSWIPMTLTMNELNLDMATWKPWNCCDPDELVAKFDEHLAAALAAMQGYPDAELYVPWTLKVNGVPSFTQPRVAVLRGMMLNHMVHHRAQLGVYLRLLNIPVPSVYGPSADEGSM